MARSSFSTTAGVLALVCAAALVGPAYGAIADLSKECPNNLIKVGRGALCERG